MNLVYIDCILDERTAVYKLFNKPYRVYPSYEDPFIAEHLPKVEHDSKFWLSVEPTGDVAQFAGFDGFLSSFNVHHEVLETWLKTEGISLKYVDKETEEDTVLGVNPKQLFYSKGVRFLYDRPFNRRSPTQLRVYNPRAVLELDTKIIVLANKLYLRQKPSIDTRVKQTENTEIPNESPPNWSNEQWKWFLNV